jgi:hypothetical protein
MVAKLSFSLVTKLQDTSVISQKQEHNGFSKFEEQCNYINHDIFYRYTAACSKLLVQYKAAFKQVQNDEFPNVERFMKKYKVLLLIIVFEIHLGDL